MTLSAMQEKLDQLSRRIVEAERELSRQAIRVENLQEQGRPLQRAEEALQAKRKRLASLRTSCEIIERHIAARTRAGSMPAPTLPVATQLHQLRPVA